ncbi:MAG: response regulator [bacterium]
MGRILALTEEIEMIEEVEQLLQDEIQVEIAVHGDTLDFLENLLERYTQLVILDLDILREKVTKLIHIIRSIHKDCKIILILSQEKMSICSTALSMGVFSYLIKPVAVLNAYNIILSALKKPVKNMAKG